MQNTSLDCQLCFKLSEQPQNCQSCGQIYCLQCLTTIWSPAKIECIQCSSKNFGPLPTVLQETYNELKLKGQNTAPKLNVVGLQKVMVTQGQPSELERINTKCANFQFCNSQVAKIYQKEDTCSIECLFFMAIVELKLQGKYKEMRPVIQKTIELIKQLNKGNPNNQVQAIGQKQVGLGITDFKFSVSGSNVKLNGVQVLLSEDVYVFRTTLSDRSFTQGVHYWEITLLSLTENEIKLGVSKSNSIDLNTGFCDYVSGWAYYTVGQLRHGSNSAGTVYGAKAKNSGTIGVLLDMNLGVLAFSCDGLYLGVAYRDQELKSGPIYPAVAMLHKAGFTVRTGIPFPSIFNDIYK